MLNVHGGDDDGVGWNAGGKRVACSGMSAATSHFAVLLTEMGRLCMPLETKYPC